ncbi:hypothetical protein BH20ACI2_BH20ACI2_05160 [soil metagenome]
MKKTPFFILLAITALFVAACEPPPAANTNTNANTNAAKPTAAAPTAESLMALDRQATEAWFKGDVKTFEDILHSNFVMYDSGQRIGKANLLKMVGSNKCDVTASNYEDPQMSRIDNDSYVVSYKGTFDVSCTGPDGKSMKVPSPVRAATIWVRDGAKWVGAYHGETLIVDPKNPPAPTAEKKEEPKKDDTGTGTNTNAANSNTASNSNTAAPATPTASANTAALVKLHTEGWEAWKAKDGKKLSGMSTSNLAIVDPMGNWVSGRDAVVKVWTETMKCEGVNNVSVSEGFATALSPTVELLTLKGTADGTCDGQKNGPVYQTAVYVKEGDAWKLAFMFEAPGV